MDACACAHSQLGEAADTPRLSNHATMLMRTLHGRKVEVFELPLQAENAPLAHRCRARKGDRLDRVQYRTG